ncbi:replication-associated recombination protein A [Halanaerobiaceae bacterium Z-7014]|uniref:Replication-associated recombination protein A n=1 Tax=Halonatronomonas betaini TaxID=2778430 RepID=A0A931ANM4_9FIRM|nr:replication-associated recombination protein A [Halonatronomonas betaini]MBF8436057.1 replication-associated recombination protein A [Halonatronomonas betaini]
MDLFSNKQKNNDKAKPLAYRMRPENFSEIYGQEDIIGEGKLLRRMIESDRLQSLILYGPPGSGKTSLAKIIADHTDSDFVKLNAVTSGVKDLREVIKKGENNIKLYNQRTILFIDEIHRFNKSQQDALLPSVEEGIIIMIGATTENPYFEVNSPLLSRSRVFKLESLKKEDIKKIIKQALKDNKNGLGEYKINIDEEAIDFLADRANGDARVALNGLEIAVFSTSTDSKGEIVLDKEIIAESLQEKIVKYDKAGDRHYDVISAFIKSIRGSDPDAALYWLALMLEAGEDPMFIGRRLIVHASEDIGMADPGALQIAVSAVRALEYIGMPEARIPLAQATIHLATAPKSNSVIEGIDKALKFVRNNDYNEVPIHLRDSHYSGSKDLNHGDNYKYPHNYENNYIEQNYLPEKYRNIELYHPDVQGREKKIKDFLDNLKKDDNGGDLSG